MTNSARRQELFLDGIELSIEMALIAYERLRVTITKHTTEKQNQQTESSLTTQMLLDAWSIVDSVNRLRVLIQHTPNLKKNAPGIVSFLKGTETITTLRHFVQHLEKKANEVAKTGKPIWGSLSWIWATLSDLEEKRVWVRTFIPGRLAKSKGHPVVNPVGKMVVPPVDHINLTAAETTVDLSQIIEVVKRFKSRYEKALSNTHTKQSSDEEATLPIVVDLD
jgi:hypothetical protein